MEQVITKSPVGMLCVQGKREIFSYCDIFRYIRRLVLVNCFGSWWCFRSYSIVLGKVVPSFLVSGGRELLLLLLLFHRLSWTRLASMHVTVTIFLMRRNISRTPPFFAISSFTPPWLCIFVVAIIQVVYWGRNYQHIHKINVFTYEINVDKLIYKVTKKKVRYDLLQEVVSEERRWGGTGTEATMYL